MPSVWFLNNSGDSIGNKSVTLRDFRYNSWYTDAKLFANGDMLLVGHGDSSRVITRKPFQFVERMDTLGNTRWRYFFPLPGPFANLDSSPVMEALPDGGALIAISDAYMPGSTRTGIIPVATLVRLDSTGAVLYSRQLGQPYSSLRSIRPCPDGSYVLAGYQWRAGAGQPYRADGWVLRVELSRGDSLRSRYFSSPGHYDDYFNDVRLGPDGELQLAGYHYDKGWLLRLDSLLVPRWQHLEDGFRPGFSAGFLRSYVLQNGQVLAHGYRGNSFREFEAYVGAYTPPPTSSPVGTPAVPAWQVQEGQRGSHLVSFFDPNGDLTLGGAFSVSSNTNPNVGGQNIILTRYRNAGLPYQPDLCRLPPHAEFGYAVLPGSAGLQFVDVSTAGPRYAQLLRWRWDFGDGTTFDGPTPPPHVYPATPTAGTAVRLTVTNNLGCTSTQVLYPFGLATAAGRAAQARLQLWPNPASATVRVQLPGLRPQPPVAAELLDALGRPVRTLRLAPAELAQGYVLALAGLPPGVYALRLQPQEGTITRRLLVQ